MPFSQTFLLPDTSLFSAAGAIEGAGGRVPHAGPVGPAAAHAHPLTQAVSSGRAGQITTGSKAWSAICFVLQKMNISF